MPASQTTLTMTDEGPSAAIFRFGMFNTVVGFIHVFFLTAPLHELGRMTCNCQEAAEYSHTALSLLSLLLCWLGFSAIQALYMTQSYVPLPDLPRWRPTAWLFGRSLVQALPVLILTFAFNAWPEDRLLYLYASLSALGLWLAFGSRLGQYRIRYSPQAIIWSENLLKGILGILLAWLAYVFIFMVLPVSACQCRAKANAPPENLLSISAPTQNPWDLAPLASREESNSPTGANA